MDYNENKYWAEGSDLLTEAEKIQFAKELIELERQGILEYRDGLWGLAAGVEIAETPDGPVARFRKQDAAVPSQFAESSATSSGEPSDAQGAPPLTTAARPSAEGSSSPDSNHHKRVLRERRSRDELVSRARQVFEPY
jgi:hypothetical protein